MGRRKTVLLALVFSLFSLTVVYGAEGKQAAKPKYVKFAVEAEAPEELYGEYIPVLMYHHFANRDMITADYLWDFVLDEFNKKVTKYGVVTERFNSYRLHVAKAGENHLRVFKGILLLNALNNIANSETVIPSEENIRNMFVGTPVDDEIDDILIANIRPYFQKIWKADCSDFLTV